jgi:hypothetical protein
VPRHIGIELIARRMLSPIYSGTRMGAIMKLAFTEFASQMDRASSRGFSGGLESPEWQDYATKG